MQPRMNCGEAGTAMFGQPDFVGEVDFVGEDNCRARPSRRQRREESRIEERFHSDPD